MSDKAIPTLLFWAYRYLGYRSRTEKEMRSYLAKKIQTYGFSPEKEEEIVTLLKNDDYLNDLSFIEEFIRARSTSKPKGEYALRQELLQKGIAPSLIDEYFSSHTLPESELADKALTRIWYRIKNLETSIRRKKSTDFLRRRGFSYDVIQKTIEELEAREYN